MTIQLQDKTRSPDDPILKGELVSMIVAGQLVGIPVDTVQDILGAQRITPVPMAAREVAGVLNLRGRIVTAINLRRRLKIPDPADGQTSGMSVVVAHEGELYSLLIDQVGEVLTPPADRFERDVVSLSPAWRDVATGIFRLDNQLLVLLDVGRVLQFDR
ncbi:MAG: chemotaxis protein CheW [Geminicoccaceae bacterium]|nr:chemotaxis protein CheW [Geminicoccaceae bacterium]MCB9944326.1 chemotaxis protein CheW [Geminicoccaceae bacterium]